MGYVLDELAEPDQSVRGCIIALENGIRLSRALRVTTNIVFYSNSAISSRDSAA